MELGIGCNAALQVEMYGLVGLCFQGSPSGDFSVLKRTSSPLLRDPTLHLPKLGWAVTGEALSLGVCRNCALMASCRLHHFAGHGGLQGM